MRVGGPTGVRRQLRQCAEPGPRPQRKSRFRLWAGFSRQPTAQCLPLVFAMSRFCRCPVCGVHVALVLAQAHAESHFGEGPRTSSSVRGAPSTQVIGGGADSLSRKRDEREDAPPASGHAGAGPEDNGTAGARQLAGPWSFMNRPSARDVRGPRRSRKAFDTPPQPYDYLVVLDYEWTCDNRQKLEPLEIIEFPSVLVRCSFPPCIVDEFQVTEVSVALSRARALSRSEPSLTHPGWHRGHVS